MQRIEASCCTGTTILGSWDTSSAGEELSARRLGTNAAMRDTQQWKWNTKSGHTHAHTHARTKHRMGQSDTWLGPHTSASWQHHHYHRGGSHLHIGAPALAPRIVHRIPSLWRHTQGEGKRGEKKKGNAAPQEISDCNSTASSSQQWATNTSSHPPLAALHNNNYNTLQRKHHGFTHEKINISSTKTHTHILSRGIC
jgi:hypothetical protein